MACSPTYLEQALIAAGENRGELEKVLKHYAEDPKDSLKLKAARFLIENMPGHVSWTGDSIEAYHRELDAILSDRSLSDWEQRLEVVSRKYENLLFMEEDVKLITSGYLISNIDSAFSAWDNPWAQHVDFDDFCEYILPYKAVNGQPFENWREVFYSAYEDKMDPVKNFVKYQRSAFWASTWVNRSVGTLIRFENGNLNLKVPVYLPSLLPRARKGNCFQYALLGLNVMRAKGIPVMMDFTPQWPFMTGRHHWNVVLSNQGRNVVFLATESDPGMPHKVDAKMAKVFRKTYAINRGLLELNNECLYVPEVFRDFFIKDVTGEYMQTCDVEVEALPQLERKEKYAYLAVFDNKNWKPVQWAAVHRGRATFKAMGRDIVYLPIYYTPEGIIPMADPFLIDCRGKVVRLNADASQTQSVSLNRKYPPSDAAYEMGKRMIGGKIQASHKEDFSPATTLREITAWCSSGSVEIPRDSAWRYWRFLSPPGGHCNISEFVFLQQDSLRPIKGQVIGTEKCWEDSPVYSREKAFDGDPLTFFDTPERYGWVGMDFGEPIRIRKILYIPRTDGNMIQPGDTYVLYYWAENGWVPADKPRIAKDIVLNYEQVPRNALFLLRNLSRGKEERIFTYENGKQIWW